MEPSRVIFSARAESYPNRSRLVRSVSIVSIAMSIAALSLATPVAAGTHDPNRYRAVEYNMWGWHSGQAPFYNSGSPMVVAAWGVWSQDAYRPHTFVLSEVCRGQTDTISVYLAQYGYTSYFLPSKSTFWNGTIKPHGPNGYALEKWVRPQVDTRCDEFGNAIFVRGPSQSAGGAYYSWQALVTKEYRNFLCVHTAYPVYWSCVSHFVPNGHVYNNTQINQYQMNEYQGWIQSKIASGATTIAGGDGEFQ